MKKLAILLGLISLVASFSSCSDYGDDVIVTPKEEKKDPKTPDNPTDDPKVGEIDWSAEMERTFGYDQATGKWPSTINVHYLGGKDSMFVAYCPMTSKIEAVAEKIVDTSTPATTYINVDPEVSLDSTEWYKESDGYYYRTITRTQKVFLSTYEAIVTSTHVEAKMVLEGKELYFLHGTEATPTKKEFTTTDGGEKERFGKNYTIEVCDLSMSQHLHGLRYIDLTASTNILREKLEDMPNPDLAVSNFGLVNNITFSPEFQGNNVIWHKVCLTENTINGTEYFSIWVDGSFVRTVELNSGESNEKYNSAYLADGTWVPAILKYSSAGDGGWDYTFVVNGNPGIKTINQNMALMSGLSNFKKDNNASQTPSVLTTTSVKEYNGKKLVTVNGYDKDNRPVISFTIGECL